MPRLSDKMVMDLIIGMEMANKKKRSSGHTHSLRNRVSCPRLAENVTNPYRWRVRCAHAHPQVMAMAYAIQFSYCIKPSKHTHTHRVIRVVRKIRLSRISSIQIALSIAVYVVWSTCDACHVVHLSDLLHFVCFSANKIARTRPVARKRWKIKQ